MYFSNKSCKANSFYGKKCNKIEVKNLLKTAICFLERRDKDLFPNIEYTLLKCLSVMPIFVATVERSLFSLRESKSYLRNTTFETKLNDLALLSIRRGFHVSDEEVWWYAKKS